MNKSNIVSCPNQDWMIETISDLPLGARLFKYKSWAISERIQEVLNQKNLLRKDLAELLGKSEPEISKWMGGEHNFTLKTLAYIESMLEEEIISTKMETTMASTFVSGCVYMVRAKPKLDRPLNWNSLDATPNIYEQHEQIEQQYEPMAA